MTGNSDDLDCDEPVAEEEEVLDSAEEMDHLQYEWQFEILNHFPRDKAIELVEHLKSLGLQWERATEKAVRLTAEVGRLKDQLKCRHVNGRASELKQRESKAG